ncbi:unnamed protein product [Effrenium voratum]|nr:unnamed protein product [Effrenium voratum]CAJ1445679.1 unnamed protein product [Effrenium voratum]
MLPHHRARSGLVASGRASLRGDGREARRGGASPGRLPAAPAPAPVPAAPSAPSTPSRAPAPSAPRVPRAARAPRARAPRLRDGRDGRDGREDEKLAMALLEQDVADAEAREVRAREARESNRRLREDELLATMLAMSQVQEAHDMHMHDMHHAQAHTHQVGKDGWECDVAEVQRQSLVEAIRAQLPVTHWAKDSPGECALCLDEYAAGDCVMRLNCFHAFHKACLDPWLDKSPTCPSCKLDLISEWS